jgi:hypothetical protein
MFRIVRESVPAPHFLILCDHGACGSFHARAVSFEGRIVDAATDNTASIVGRDREAFFRECGSSGWLVDIGVQLCPVHHQAVKDIIRPPATAPLIEVPKPHGVPSPSEPPVSGGVASLDAGEAS